MVSCLHFSLRTFAYPLVVNPKTKRPAGMISKEIYEIVMAHAEQLDSAVIYERDFQYNLYVVPKICPFVSTKLFSP